MNIKIDKRLTSMEYAKQVREDMKQFKACYTDNELLFAFCEHFDYDICADVLRADVDAYETYGETQFYITLWLNGLHEVFRVTFVVDVALNVTSQTYTVTRYTQQC